MVKILVSAVGALAIMGGSAMACSNHSKSGGKGSVTSALSSKVIVVAKAPIVPKVPGATL